MMSFCVTYLSYGYVRRPRAMPAELYGSAALVLLSCRFFVLSEVLPFSELRAWVRHFCFNPTAEQSVSQSLSFCEDTLQF